MWATDIRFLNDSAEFTFARDVLLAELQQRIRGLRNRHVKSLVERKLSELLERTSPHM